MFPRDDITYVSGFGDFGREIRIVIGDNYYIYPQFASPLVFM